MTTAEIAARLSNLVGVGPGVKPLTVKPHRDKTITVSTLVLEVLLRDHDRLNEFMEVHYDEYEDDE